MLEENLKQIVDDYVSTTGVDVEDLPSYRLRKGKRYDEARFTEPDEEYWDEDEEYEAAINQAYVNIKEYGVFETLGIEETEENTNKVLRYLLLKLSGTIVN